MFSVDLLTEMITSCLSGVILSLMTDVYTCTRVRENTPCSKLTEIRPGAE